MDESWNGNCDIEVDGPLVTAMISGSWVLLSHAEQAGHHGIYRVTESPISHAFELGKVEANESHSRRSAGCL